MMNSIERNRRQRLEICSGCGWHMVQEEDGRYTCCNARCIELGRPKGPPVHPALS